MGFLFFSATLPALSLTQGGIVSERRPAPELAKSLSHGVGRRSWGGEQRSYCMLSSPGSFPGVGGFMDPHALLWTLFEWSWQIGEPCSVPKKTNGWNFILSVFFCVCLLNKLQMTNWGTAEWGVFHTFTWFIFYIIMFHRHRWHGFHSCAYFTFWVNALSNTFSHGNSKESHIINAGRKMDNRKKIIHFGLFWGGTAVYMSPKDPNVAVLDLSVIRHNCPLQMVHVQSSCHCRCSESSAPY